MAHTIKRQDEDVFDTQRFTELITRYSGTLSTLIGDQARKGIRRHREDLLYLEKWGIDETERSGRSIDDLNSEKLQRIARLKEQLELAELMAFLDMAGFAESMHQHFTRARQES